MGKYLLVLIGVLICSACIRPRFILGGPAPTKIEKIKIGPKAPK